MSLTTLDPAEADRIYEAARVTDGPYNQGKPFRLKGREPYHLVRDDGFKVLDLHGHILADCMGDPAIRKHVREVMDEVNDVAVFAPDFTHPELDRAQARIAQILDEVLGGGPWVVSFKSSGTRANEENVGHARAVLGGDMHAVLNAEAYHGAGFMKSLIGLSSWKARATVPLGIPVTHLDYADTPEGRNHLPDFRRFKERRLGADGRPLYISEAGVGGVMGFRLIEPGSTRNIIVEVHERKGKVILDAVQTMDFRTGDNPVGVDGIVDRNDPRTIPDYVTGGKGIGVGYPLAFSAARKAVIDEGMEVVGQDAGGKDIVQSHFAADYDTNARSLQGSAAFNALDQKMISPGFVDGMRTNMAQWRGGLETIAAAHSERAMGVTGKGYMSGLELDSGDRVAAFRKIGVERTGIVCCVGGVRKNVLRLGMKLDAPPEIVAEALQKIEDTLRAA
ncbi:hypothetical protein HYW83_05825 [Candidatus Peregrinibacteria bacterium]|nr:hypothetical protein [Candidatus Peregrinibacteria bacterium]